MKKQDTTNTFGEGMIMDLNPLVTPNNVVTNCLNGTLITYNGNENVLQNDMGNGRVETAYLPEGYVPLGTAELGGIVYIVSYNPLIDKCQIGSFPSPERNITSDEFPDNNVTVKNAQFQSENGKILNTILKVKLLKDSESEDGIFKLNPGDKYTIYSTNNGITANASQISDVGNPLHIVDTDPNNVTIHVVSIGDDGKIVYLDDSLKWNDDTGTPADYYIKECKQGNTLKTDIDDYRSLVSSAYNVFNSKVSGELALLFELKTINTFSVTWDAEVEDISGVTEEQIEEGINNKEAQVFFNINYTSDHQKINLKHVLLTDSSFPNGPMETQDPVVQKGNHCTFGLGTDRKNDGSDEDLVTKVGTFKYNSKGQLSDYIWNYALTPAMKFGYLDYLTLKGSINFLEIGSGKTELDEWRYFIQDDNFYLNWGLSAYPEKNKKIFKILMTFIPFDEVDTSTILTDLESTYEGNTKYPQYTITDKNSYSGYFQELIPFNSITSKVKNAEIKPNFLYLVDVCIDYGSENNIQHRHNYKWLYTTKQWNDVFVHSDYSDFTTIPLDEVLKFGPEFTVDDKIASQANEYNSNIIFPRIYDETTQKYTVGEDQLEQPYAVAGAYITAVNYNEKSKTFDTSQKSISVDVQAKCTSYPELFQFQETSNDSYKFELKETSITHDEFLPKSDTRASALVSQTISKVAEQNPTTQKIDMPANLGTTIGTIIDKGIRNETINSDAKDSFKATLTTNKAHFDINIVGAIFARINADLAIKPVSVGQEIRPLLYTDSDYALLGLKSSTEFIETFTEEHGDGGGNKPFYFKFTSTGGLNHKSNKKNWDPSDDWSRQNWWDNIPPYNNYLNPRMLAAQGSFQAMKYVGGKATQFNGANIQGQWGLWARTSEGHYVPINNKGTQSQLATLVASLYAQIYQVNTDTINKELPVVTNVNYLTNYSESWHVGIESSLKIGNILDNVVLVSENNTISLSDLQEKCKDLPIDITNISRENLDTLEFESKTLQHTFYIQNVELYNQYDDAKATEIPAIALLSSKETWEKCSPKTKNSLYVYNKNNKDSIEFVKLNQSAAQYLYRTGTFATKSIDNEDRVIFTGTGDIVGKLNPIYGCFQLNRGVIQLLQYKLLASKVQMRFQTSSKGDPWSTVHNNSGYGLGNKT